MRDWQLSEHSSDLIYFLLDASSALEKPNESPLFFLPGFVEMQFHLQQFNSM